MTRFPASSSVDTNRRLGDTATGMNILTTNANQVSGYQLRTFIETWAEPVLRQLQLLEAYYETDEVILGLAGQAAMEQMQKFGQDQITDDLLMNEMTVNINVGMGATNPHTQVDNFLSGMKSLKEILADGVLDRYGLDVEAVSKELFSKLGYRSGSRFFKWQDQDPAIIALQNTVQQLQDALDKKVQPELMQAQIAKLNSEVRGLDAKTIEAIGKAIYAAMQTGEIIAAVPQVVPIADEVMRISGYVPPSPAGVDPNFPQPGGVGALAVEAVKNKHTGIAFTPGAAGDTSPQTPALPPSPAAGVTQGINTMRADG